MRKNIFNKTAMLAIVMLLVILALISLTPEIASSQQDQSRIYNLEFDIRELESRLNQIESQLNQRGIVSPRTPGTANPNNRGRNRQQLKRSQTFENLANLVIETRQDVKQLEARVSKLESQQSPRKADSRE